MNAKQAKTYLSKGKAVYLSLSDDRYRVIRIGTKFVETLSGEKIQLQNTFKFDLG